MVGKFFSAFFGSSLALSNPTFPSGDVDGFWTWFAANSAALRQSVQRSKTDPPIPEHVLNTLQAALGRVHPGLAFELGINKDNKLDLVISADGIERDFPAVIALHDAMPASQIFTSTAFRGRNPDVQLKIAGRTLKPTDASYVAQIDDANSKIDVWLFLPLPEDATDSDRMTFGFLLLDLVLGEYDVATSLGGIEFHPMVEAPPGAKELPNLAAEVDAFNTKRSRQ